MGWYGRSRLLKRSSSLVVGSLSDLIQQRLIGEFVIPFGRPAETKLKVPLRKGTSISLVGYLGVQSQERPMPTMEHGHIVETPVEARAGLLDRPVFTVLMTSTVVVIIAFILAYFGAR